MAQEGFKRKLSAILSADVAGYSRLMGDDEESTILTLTDYRSTITKLTQQYRGRVVDAPGDNILAAFPSVVDSVNCAVEIQRELVERNAELSENRKMEFRIGINLGDVIEEGERIYGDGVNIAARMEGLAEPGGICISGTVYDAVETKTGLEYEYLGEQEVKNIPRPVRVYRVLTRPTATVAGKVEKGKWAVMLLVLIVIAGGWYLFMRSPTEDPASLEKLSSGKISVAERPFNSEIRKRDAAEIARLEKELAALGARIAEVRKNSSAAGLDKKDGLSAMLTMVEEKEMRQQEERKLLAEMDRLRKEKEERRRRLIGDDMAVYEKIISSSYGEDLKVRAWKELVANYPEAADLTPGSVDVLRMLLFKSWIEPTTGMEFIWVEGGCFQMGDIFGEGDDDERPIHEVCVDSFGMSRHEVTQGQWRKIMGNNPSRSAKGSNYPVEQISWNDTQDFIRNLNSLVGRSFRLPTEAEWEYAARSGGREEKYAGGGDVDRLGWYEGNSGGSAHPVGTKEPNGLGFYDMSGNLWEWCSDWYDIKYYRQSPRHNPQGPSSGSFRVIRDGCWNGSSHLARSGNRDSFRPGYSLDNIGFRLVLTSR